MVVLWIFIISVLINIIIIKPTYAYIIGNIMYIKKKKNK